MGSGANVNLVILERGAKKLWICAQIHPVKTTPDVLEELMNSSANVWPDILATGAKTS